MRIAFWKFKCQLDSKFSNRQIEYEAIIMRLIYLHICRGGPRHGGLV